MIHLDENTLKGIFISRSTSMHYWVLQSYRFQPVYNGHHDVAFVVLLEIQNVEGGRSP